MTADDRVLVVVRGAGFASTGFVADVVGLSPAHVRVALKQLAAMGLIVGIGATRNRVWFDAAEYLRCITVRAVA